MTPTADLVADLVAEVGARVPVDEREARSQAAIVAALGRLPHPLDEHADRVHVTASAIVVSERGVLLHRHKRLGRWLQPGGHVDPGEAPSAAAVREVVEETGLVATHPDAGPSLVHVDVHDAARGHVHLDLRYLLEAPPDEPRPPPGESPDVSWFDWDAVVVIADDALVGALRALDPRPR